jgi:hypothetical protein
MKTDYTITIHVRKVFEFAEGGLMSFANGGIVSAASGRMFTTSGPTMALIGDNPGGRESVWAIPHNNPGPTVARIDRMYKGGTDSKGGSTLNQNLVLKIDGNEIINDVKITRKIRTVMGSDMDRYG